MTSETSAGERQPPALITVLSIFGMLLALALPIRMLFGMGEFDHHWIGPFRYGGFSFFEFAWTSVLASLTGWTCWNYYWSLPSSPAVGTLSGSLLLVDSIALLDQMAPVYGWMIGQSTSYRQARAGLEVAVGLAIMLSRLLWSVAVLQISLSGKARSHYLPDADEYPPSTLWKIFISCASLIVIARFGGQALHWAGLGWMTRRI